MEYRNPQYTAEGHIDCEINHPVYGWIPFTCNPNDSGAEFDTKAFFLRMAPESLPYVAPPPPVPTEEEIRAKRDALLAASDWTQLPDAQAAMYDWHKAAWAAYRQALRDVPQQEGFTANVIWPSKPQ